MRRITMLAVAALAIGGCDFPVSLGPMCWDGCGGGGGSSGSSEPGITVVGFPWAKIDTTGWGGPGTAALARLAVGDSVTLYLVRVPAGANPCVTADTVRTVRWGMDTTVLRVRTDSTGRGAITAVGRGLTPVYASMGVVSIQDVGSCNGATMRWANGIIVD